MLGSEIVETLTASGIAAIPWHKPVWDFTREEDLERAVKAAEILVNCAAYTQVDNAESETELAYQINAQAVDRLGQLAARYQRYVLHFSTDFVYDGTLDRAYTEADATHPLNVYGASKLLGESHLRHSGCRHAIVRLEWLYGKNGANFITRLCQRASTAGVIRMVDDQIGAPTDTSSVAQMAKEIIIRQLEGCFLFALAGYVSRYDIARFILTARNIDIPVEPIKTADLNLPARRPLNSRFDCGKIDAALECSRPRWDVVLGEYLRNNEITRMDAAK